MKTALHSVSYAGSFMTASLFSGVDYPWISAGRAATMAVWQQIADQIKGL
jgi:hypothetical protein